MTEISYTPGPLLDAARTTSTSLWNDSSDLDELQHSITCGAVGATCNPVIALATISRHLDEWEPRIREIAAANPAWGESQIGWQAVKEMSVAAAALLKPIFDEHGGHNGRLSVQTDPRLHRDIDAIVAQAVEFDALAENIVVKIPATSRGIEAIEEATARGVSVNVTVSISVPQAVRAAEAIERGLDRRAAQGKDIAHMGPVVTLMVGRLDDWMKHVVARDRVFIDTAALEWAGIAAFKKAHAIFTERGFRSRMLSAAFRNVNHWAEFVGGDVVVSPPFAWQQIINESDYRVIPRMDEPVNPAYLAELNRLEDFRRAYDEDGMTVEEFDAFGPTARTLRQFLEADADLDTLVRNVIIPVP